MTRTFRTIWISDIHLGSRGCQAERVLSFLEHTRCETLFLVGDIVDGWALARSWNWPKAHNTIIQKILKKLDVNNRAHAVAKAMALKITL